MATGAVFVVTAASSVAQTFVPGMLAAWQRSPAVRHGDAWRLLTALLVQDGGVLGAVSNLAFLLVLGVAAEQGIGRWQWVTCYLGAGLAGEIVGLAWQPTGAGNSVAICGLAGALVVALWRRGRQAPRHAAVLTLYWCAAVLMTAVPRALILWVAIAALAPRALSHRPWRERVVSVAAAVVAVGLCVARDVHGAALAAGIGIAGAMALGDGSRPPPCPESPGKIG